MKKLLFTIAALAFFAVSCENTTSKKEDNNKQEMVISDEIIAVSMLDFDSLVESLSGRKITISGTVDHVCKHGGQKLFIVDENSDTRIKITPNDEIAAFNTELVGETIKITGIVEEMRVDEDYLIEWEEEVKAGAEEDVVGEGKRHGDGKGESADEGDHSEEQEDIDIQDELDQIARMRTRVEESEKGYLSFYSILALEYKIFKMN